MFRLRGRSGRGKGHATRRAVEGLLSSDAFEEQLMKERARTDRGGGPFTVLALKIDAEPDSEAFIQAAWVLVALLKDRTRLTDTKGWFGDRIGVILPNTTCDKVIHVWPPIQEAFDKRARTESTERVTIPRVSYEVYAYPSDGQANVPHELKRAPRAQ